MQSRHTIVLVATLLVAAGCTPPAPDADEASNAPDAGAVLTPDTAAPSGAPPEAAAAAAAAGGEMGEAFLERVQLAGEMAGALAATTEACGGTGEQVDQHRSRALAGLGRELDAAAQAVFEQAYELGRRNQHGLLDTQPVGQAECGFAVGVDAG